MSSLADTFLLDSVHQLLHLPEALEKLTRGGGAANGHGGERRGQEAVEKGWGSVPVDIMETPKGYTFILDVPGLSKSDIQVTVEDDNVLVVKSGGGGGGRKRKQEEREEEGCRYVRLERKAYPKFVRKFRLPEDSDLDAITAKCENGELTVAVGKLPPPPEAKPKTVEVKIG